MTEETANDALNVEIQRLREALQNIIILLGEQEAPLKDIFQICQEALGARQQVADARLNTNGEWDARVLEAVRVYACKRASHRIIDLGYISNMVMNADMAKALTAADKVDPLRRGSNP